MIWFKEWLILFCGIPFSLFSQTIDNTASFRSMESTGYFRLHYENDFFTASDFYYSQGINLEFCSPALINNPLNLLLPKMKNSGSTFGLALEHAVFTPSSIRNAEIMYNDHPYAAYMILKTFLISTDTLNFQRLSSTLSIGGIGPIASGDEMQKSIHKWLKNIEPLGWQHQIKNDIILNYELTYEQQLYNYKNYFLLSSLVKIQAGTLMDNAQIGCTVMAGRFNSPYASSTSSILRIFKLYGYAQPLVRMVGYDATLQGGMFNRDNPYTLSSQQLTRIVFETNFGLVLGFQKVYLEYYQSLQTKEFQLGKYHRWGGIRVGIIF
ncbi:MAG: lipid A deacylase LpxR family protein [Bacteroidia bacterium]|nr:lipid A deacylase LpxR family protein [Bacteroidia bacterium]